MRKCLSLLIFLGLTGLLPAQEKALYVVNGYVYLENHTDHSGVKVKFYNLPSMEPEDSTVSQANGYYSIAVSPGYYLVEWTKTGYVPWELGGFALAENTVLDPIILIAGQVQEVSGSVSGNWTTGFVYYVVDNITVPTGQTLTIDAGVRVKFAKGKSMTCNGKLIVNGTSAKPVLFTSKEPTPLPGDWGNVTLNSTYNNINYLKYEYATDGIIGSNAHNTKIDHLTIQGSLALTARGIYFTNSQNLTFTNNFISVAGEYGIYADNSDNSTFSGNTIVTPTYGLRADGSDNSIISNNTITTSDNTTGPKHAIYTPNSPRIRIENNTIVADENGIHTPNSFKATITNNNITGRIFWNGIKFTDSDSSLVTENYVHRTKYNGYEDSWQYLINGNASEFSEISYNDLYFWNASDAPTNRVIWCEWSKVKFNKIEFRTQNYAQYGIYDERNSDIMNNQIRCTSFSHSTTNIIRSYSDGTTISKITDNIIEYYCDGYDRFESAILCQNNKIIRNNKITCNYLHRAIYCQSNCDVDSNEIFGDFSVNVIEIDGNNTIIHDNKITQTGSGNGIYVQGQTGIEIKNNTFKQTASARWLVADNSQVNVHHNVVTTGSGRGAYIYNQSGGSLWNNTLVSKTTGDYGVYIENQTNIPVYNNIIAGFQNGLYADNTIKNYNLDHNAFWNLSGVIFNGSAIPPLAGQIIDDNANGDPSDIYENINLNPQFVYPDTGNYNLLGNSPCINAGKSTIKDADSTVADIGALYYPIYIVITHTPLTSTNNTTGPYTVTAQILSPSGLNVTAQLYYSTDNQNYTAVNMTKGSGNSYSANIPGQPLNTTIYYYIQANDGVHIVTAPRNINTQKYSFYITLFSQFAGLGGQSEVDGKIALGWATPIPISGTLTGLKLYRSLNASCELIPANLYQSFAADVVQFTDANVEEGITYYYRLSGLLTDGGTTTESVVSSVVGIMSDNAGIVRVVGTVRLQSQSDHSGVKVYFEKVSPSAVADSLFTGSDGKISIVMKTGIYNIHFTKDGYQPVMLGNRFLSANTQLDTIAMRPGGSQNLSGNIEGTLLSSNIYFIESDVTVPAGKILTIQAGTTLKFRGKYSLKVEGKILAEGTAENHIVFTSAMPSPLEGDWKRITLTNAQKSVFRYCDFYYAENGFLLNNSDGSTFDHCYFDRFLINAIGFDDGDYNNNDSLTITNNTFRNTFYRAVSLDRGFGSTISQNDIVATEWAIFCNECDGSEFNDNIIHSIGDGNYTGGIHSHNSEGSEYLRNRITGFREIGIYFNGSANSIVSDNFIADTNQVGKYDGGGTNGIYNDHRNQNCRISKNIINVHITSGFGGNGIVGNDSKIDSNSIKGFSIECAWVYGIKAENSYIESNEINITNGHYYRSAIISAIGNGGVAIVRKNIGYANTQTCGIWASCALIEDNIFYGINNNDFAALGKPGLKLRNNKFINFNFGLVLEDGQDCIIENNEFILTGDQGGYISGGNNTILRRNVFLMDGDNTYGLKFTDSNVSTVFQNSIVSTKSQPSGTGIIVENNAHPIINSNLIHGFTTGINASSSVYDLKFNDISNYQTAFSGVGLPNQVGQIVTVNNNLMPSDIYSNILLDPVFVDLTAGNINLKSTSPCINAGDICFLDEDGTVADIGAKIYNYGFVPQNLVVDSTGNGWVAFSWEITETDSLNGYIPYYKLSSSSTWTSTGKVYTKSATISGLTNNVNYDFCVAAVYPTKSSNLSKQVTSKPGVAIMEVSPKYITVFQQPGETTVKEFTIANSGTKDLMFLIKVDRSTQLQDFEYLGEFNDHYYYQSKNNVYWSAAKLACENAGGHLVTITSQSENDFIFNNKKSSEVWIGFSDQETEGQWKWVTNEPVVYTNWCSGQPDNAGNEDYGELWNNNSGTWNDGNEHLQPFILEIENFVGITSISNGTVSPQSSIVIQDTLKTVQDGIFISKVIINSNDQINTIDSVCVLQVVGNYTSLTPIHFTSLKPGEKAFNFVLESASIDGSALQTGDEVGIFAGDVCVGAGGFNGSFPMVITCYGDEGGSPGFTAGDSIIVKLYDASQARYATVTAVNYSFSSGYFVDGGFAQASLQGSVYQTISIPLAANRFNLISSYLFPRYPNATTLFSSVPGLKIAYEDNGSAYIPQYNINTIGDVDITEGYHLFVADNDRTLVITGLSIDPANFPLILQKNRFNSVGYLLSQSMPVTTAFAEIASQIEIVQDDDGGVWIPELSINTLGNLQPLSGYQVFTNAATDLTFTYPQPSKKLAKEIPAKTIARQTAPTHFRVQPTGLPYTIVIKSALMDNNPLEDGAEIGVFCNGQCVGSTIWQNGQANVLTAWKGDEKLGIIGYRTGERMAFRAFSGRFQREFELSARFVNPQQALFEGAAYTVTSLTGAPGLIPERYALHPNFPNPFNSRTVIPYDVPRESAVSIAIYDIIGREIVRLQDRQPHQPGKYRVEWNGLDANGVALSSGVYFVRMISSDYQKVQKLVLMK